MVLVKQYKIVLVMHYIIVPVKQYKIVIVKQNKIVRVVRQYKIVPVNQYIILPVQQYITVPAQWNTPSMYSTTKNNCPCSGKRIFKSNWVPRSMAALNTQEIFYEDGFCSI